MSNHNSQKTTHPVSTVGGQRPFIIGMIIALLTDAYNNLPSYSLADYSKDCSTVTRRVQSEGIQFATVMLPLLIQGMLNRLEFRESSYPGFKILPGADYPCFCKGIFAAIIGASNEAERATALKHLYQVSVAFKKLKGPYSTVQLVKQFDEFLEVDASLKSLNFDEGEAGAIMAIATRLCTRDFKSFSLDSRNTRPRPGPGATNTPRPKTMRYEPRVLYTRINRILDYQEWFYLTPWYAVDKARSFLKLHNEAQYEPSARFLFVPKTFGKARGICAEENETQVLQQGVSRNIRSMISRSYLKKHLQLTDQTHNAKAALEGSLTGNRCTIDMSEASDRISRDLVSTMFANTPLSEVLYALSTRWIIPPVECKDRNPIFTEKYAPMGSGLCFPVMSLVHFYLVKAIMMHKKHHIDSCDGILVFGDDIIVPKDAYADVTSLLPCFGMKLNLSKSYSESLFRESCGIHAYNGVDITPVYIRYIPKTEKLQNCNSLLATEHLLDAKSFHEGSKVLRSWLRSVYRITDTVGHQTSWLGFRRTMSSSPGSETSWSKADRHDPTREMRVTLRNKRRRWNPDLQCFEYKMLSLRSMTEEICIRDSAHACLRWHWMNTDKSEFFREFVADYVCSEWVPESVAMKVTSYDRILARLAGYRLLDSNPSLQ